MDAVTWWSLIVLSVVVGIVCVLAVTGTPAERQRRDDPDPNPGLVGFMAIDTGDTSGGCDTSHNRHAADEHDVAAA